ncbi:fibronectin type III domain-containing protein [Bacillus paramycoides]|uniref:fibronectin type III domain-containing protein n=1 Tax=Bacillus paramycoides TaxID=2026194 RepID=UPI003800E5BE
MFAVMFILCLSVLPSFASAQERNVFNNKGVYTSLDFDTPYLDSRGNPVVLSNSRYTEISFEISEDRSKYLYVDLGSDMNVTSIGFDANGGTNTTNYRPYFYFNFYDKNKNLISEDAFEVYNSGRFGKQFKADNKNNNVRYVGFKFASKIVLKEGIGSAFNSLTLMGDDSPRLEEIKNLNAIPEMDKVKFTWDNPNDPNFTGVQLYFEGEKRDFIKANVNEIVSTNLKPDSYYNYKFVAMYGDKASEGVEKRIRTLVDMKKVPPGPVSSLTAEPTDKTVKLKWKSPKDDDLAGFKILQNGKQVAEIGLEEEFTVKNLQSLTDYTFGVISVDKDKNDSSPVSLSVKTLEENDEEPPHVPSNVFAKPSNGALIASWDKVSDKDLAGYNLYVDGKKINSNLITSTNFVIKNLENSKKYKIQVQAVDRSGNASELSLAAFGTPDVNTIPVIESNYGVKDVSDGVGTMFSQIWPALAFSVGIVLAFYVIYKLKHTILP